MQELTEGQVDWIIGSSGLGVLALASRGDAYAIPILYARDGDAFYFHSRHGVKEDFIRDTTQACLVVTKVESVDNWRSVQVFGRVERVAGAAARAAAEGILQRLPLPPEWTLEAGGETSRHATNVFVWRLRIDKITGRKNTPA